jgi:hypothetical protein
MYYSFSPGSYQKPARIAMANRFVNNFLAGFPMPPIRKPLPTSGLASSGNFGTPRQLPAEAVEKFCSQAFHIKDTAKLRALIIEGEVLRSQISAISGADASFDDEDSPEDAEVDMEHKTAGHEDGVEGSGLQLIKPSGEELSKELEGVDGAANRQVEGEDNLRDVPIRRGDRPPYRH